VANHKSALKAHRQNVKRREANRQQRSKLRTALKTARSAQGAKPEEMGLTVSLIDKMAAKGIIHDNTAARYKSRLAKRAAKSA
jgi:small subunit ribosomal protein S20